MIFLALLKFFTVDMASLLIKFLFLPLKIFTWWIK